MEKKQHPLLHEFTKGIIKENPVLRLVLGMLRHPGGHHRRCPTPSAWALAATFVLVCSNVVISLLRNVIPDKVRIPAYITIIAGFVTIVQMLVKAYRPSPGRGAGRLSCP